MDAMDLSSAQGAAAFILNTAAPYALRQMTEGALKELGKQGLAKIETQAKAVWERLRGMFKDRPRLTTALADYEKAVQGTSPGNELAEAATNLENDLRTRFAHHPDELAELTPLLKELFAALPLGQPRNHAPQIVMDARNSNIAQIQGDGNPCNQG
ncbi:MAG TPA: hypothetical protein PKH24_06120 [Sedimentisphaerales bacterium]|nr:hypothetical protein [Sedimentisphaerales bacterium]HNU27815.1 hypothetical protein [Sedimentisphaerales bacterium]